VCYEYEEKSAPVAKAKCPVYREIPTDGHHHRLPKGPGHRGGY
jgi:hypothetical protein